VTREERERAWRVAREIARIAVNAYHVPQLKRRPLVSVIIPTFNWSSVLRFAIASVLSQTYENVELIVVGDACSDDSEQVVCDFCDHRVRWLNLKANSGSQSTPNNIGLEQARGEYVAYLGHDDLWLPSHVAHLVTALESRRGGVAASVTEAVGPLGSHVRVLAGLEAYQPGHWIPPSAIMHRRDLVDQIGGWKDYRTIVDPPDLDFLARAITVSDGLVQTGALTVIKFNSAWRQDSYRTKRSDEQAATYARVQRERMLVLRELVAIGLTRWRGFAPDLPQLDPIPEIVPPGWFVSQYRQIRGLETADDARAS
jgi:glycosyltransferase involved in cell wall biosynthesis